MKQFGIDVSHWQGDFDFSRAMQEGVTFAIVKGGGGDDGLYVDSRFAANYDKATALGLHVGCYWFSKALTAAEAEREASYFYEHCCKGRRFALPVFIDVENREMLALGKRKLTDVVLAWLRKMESCGMMAGVYSFRAAFSSYLYDGELAAYPHWVASWPKTCSFRPLGIWQAAGKNGFSAESGGAPASGGDTCSVTLPKLRQGANSGYVKTAQLLLNAYFDAGLAVDGGFGPKTYAAVVAYQRSRGLAVDGVIGAQTWRQLLC